MSGPPQGVNSSGEGLRYFPIPMRRETAGPEPVRNSFSKCNISLHMAGRPVGLGFRQGFTVAALMRQLSQCLPLAARSGSVTMALAAPATLSLCERRV